jgi:ATP-dependent DNA helicase RecG
MAGQPLPKWMQDLNKRQVQALQLVRRQGRITRREYEKLAGISRTVAKQDLQALVERGLLVRHVAGPRTYYVAHEIGSSSSSSAADRRPRNGR